MFIDLGETVLKLLGSELLFAEFEHDRGDNSCGSNVKDVEYYTTKDLE